MTDRRPQVWPVAGPLTNLSLTMFKLMPYRFNARARGDSLIRMLTRQALLVLPCLLVPGLLIATANSPALGQSETRPADPEHIIPPALLEELFREFDDELAAREERGSVDRGRTISQFEKQHRAELRKFLPVLEEVAKSTVRITVDRKPVALGTVVASDGWLVTKASEVEGHDELLCHFADGTSYPGKIVVKRDDHDLALIHVDTTSLAPVTWSDEPISIGSLVVTGDETGQPLASGVVSVERRVLIERGQAWLGVMPQPSRGGVRVQAVEPTSSADSIGLRIGDIILEIDDEAIEDVNDLANTIRRHAPGEQITIVYRRGSEERAVQATLKGRNVPGVFSRGNQEAGRFGSEPSRRSSDFPEVLQHDSHLWPEQCGGPLTDLSGKAIGVNIARGGRVESYAIPQDVVREVIDRMLKEARQAP